MKYKVIVKEMYFDEIKIDADSDEKVIKDATKLWKKQHPSKKTQV